MENKKFEDLFNELKEIIDELESGKLSLEESIDKYKLGLELSEECKKRLEEAKEVIVKKAN